MENLEGMFPQYYMHSDITLLCYPKSYPSPLSTYTLTWCKIVDTAIYINIEDVDLVEINTQIRWCPLMYASLCVSIYNKY